MIRPTVVAPHAAALTLLLAVAAGKSCDRPSLPPGSPNNGGLALPGGFEAVVVHEGIGRARHLAVTDDGIVYVKLRVPAPKGLVALRDTSGDGRADDMQVFGDYTDTGDYGTAMRIHAGHLYFTTAGEVYRLRLTPGQLVPSGPVETVLRHEYKKNLRSYEHIAKPIAFDGKGHMFVPFGAPGDSCQEQNRRPESPGRQPCPELAWQGGVWEFSDSRLNQTEQDGRRYATGIRSLVAMAWNPQVGALYAVQHGRDDLYRTWSRYFTRWQSAVLPSEEFFKVTDGFDGGWPYYYYDQIAGTKKLNPEYGGDGEKVGDGDKLTKPLIGFPGHYAPNDILFYEGDQFPERYRHGAFIAFHGSTIRMPYSQGGYIVAFVPFANGVPSGPWEVFADNIAGVDPIPNTSDAVGRPMGLAQGPDGSLYLSESEKGKIWRIMFKGNRGSFGTAQLAAMEARKTSQAHIRNPHEQDDVIGRETLDAGGQLYNTYCVACHQRDGKGDGSRFPPVAASRWVSGDPKRLIGIVLNGLQGEIQVDGKAFNGVMPANAFLTDDQVSQIATYLRQNFGNFAGGVTPSDVAAVRAAPPAPPVPPTQSAPAAPAPVPAPADVVRPAADHPLQGVWRVADDKGQPGTGVYIFTATHYSMMAASADRPDITDTSQATADQLRALWNPMMGNAGVYEIAGNLLTIRPIVAKIPVVMKPGAYEVYAFSVEGSTLTLTQQRNVRGPVEGRAPIKLIRVE